MGTDPPGSRPSTINALPVTYYYNYDRRLFEIDIHYVPVNSHPQPEARIADKLRNIPLGSDQYPLMRSK